MHPFTIYSIFLLITSFISFFVGFLSWYRRSIKGAEELSLLMFMAGIWILLDMFESVASDMPVRIFWSKLEYFGAVSIPCIYLIFILRFIGKDNFISMKHILVLFVFPVITLLLALTNEKHNIVLSGLSATSVLINAIEYDHALWFLLGFMAYNKILLLLATICLFIFIARRSNIFRSQTWIICVAGLCPWIDSLFNIAGSNPFPLLDLVPVSFMLSGILFAYAILHLQFLDLALIAKKSLVEQLQDGVLAIDSQNRIQYINEAALAFLGLPDKNIVGLPAVSSGTPVWF